MGKVFAFHGGIHPPENKHQSSKAAIVQAPMASILYVPVQQHIGVPAKVCVAIGDKVLKGQRIAEAQGKFSVPIHAPSSGTITAIGEHPIPHPSGMNALCVNITTDGLDQWVEHCGLEDYRALSKDQLIDYIRDRGIAGMGGAGFPTAVKLHLSDDHIVNTLIINAAECEPYITADDALMRERAEEIISGINILQHLIQPSHVIIGIEDNKPQAIKALNSAINATKYNIDVVSVPTKYPSGGEKQLIKLLTDIEVPSGGIPADVGIVCQNVGTVYAINKAVRDGTSLISRIVTVTGEGVSKPQNYETLIGTPFSMLLEAAGYKPEHTSKLIIGGPMMGYNISNSAIPVVKTSNCIIAASGREMPTADPAQACIRCGLCEQVCPAQLLPQQLHWFAKSQEYDKAQQHNLFDCIECGACSYVCPSNIPLVQYYRHAKTSIREEQQEKRRSDLARERFEAKQLREQRAIDEKAAKRKARADQAAKTQALKKAAATAATTVTLETLEQALLTATEKVAVHQSQLDSLHATTDSQVLNLADLKLQQAKKQQQKAQQSIVEYKAQGETIPLDSKKLKIAAAQASTQLAKAQLALKSALEKNQPGIEQLKATIALLAKEAESSTLAYQATAPQDQAKPAKTSSPERSNTAVIVDLKKLMTASAIARTKLKQAQSAYALLVAQEQQDTEAGISLMQQLALLTKRAEETEKDFVSAKPEGSQTISTDQLQQSQQRAKQQYHKALQAFEKAERENSPAVEKMRLSIEKLKQKLDNTSAALTSDGESTATLDKQSSTVSHATSEPEVQPQLDFEKANTRYQKALVTLKKAQDDGHPGAEKMQLSVDKLKVKLTDCENALRQVPSTGAVAPLPDTNKEDHTQRQLELDKANKRYQKALVTLKKAQSDNHPGAEKMQLSVDKLKVKLTDCENALRQTPSTGAVEPLPDTNTEDHTQRLLELDKANKRYQKALASLEKAQRENNPGAEKMCIAVDKLKSKLDSAEAALINNHSSTASNSTDLANTRTKLQE